MEQEIQELIQQFPKLKYLLKDPSFEALNENQKRFILEMIEDNKFWKEMDKTQQSDDGFRFMASTFGLARATAEADEKGLKGKEREEFLKPHQDLFTQFNPYSGRTSDR